MESFLQFIDELDDIVFAAAIRWQRFLPVDPVEKPPEPIS